MRVSLVTRVVVGYLLVLLMLGSLAVYSVQTMSEMRQEVVVVKHGLLPTSGQFQRLSRELSRLAAALARGTPKQTAWAAQNLADPSPFDGLDALRSRVDDLALNPRLPERTRLAFKAVSLRLSRLADSDSLCALAERRGFLVPPDVIRSNRPVYFALTQRFEQAVGSGQAKDFAIALQAVLRGIIKELSGIEAAYNLAVNTAWGDTASREETTVTAAVVLGLVSLLVIVAVFVLFLKWLRPLSALKAVANRISRGEYDGGIRIRSRDEIGELSEELSSMAARLKEREEMIRKQASELVRADRFSTIGKMATQIAHEVRNPLNAMGLKLELLEETVEDVRRRLSHDEVKQIGDGVASIGREIDRLREITDYYLKFAKFPAVEKEAVDVSALLADVLGFYAEEAGQKGIVVEKELEKQLRAKLDPNLLRHAMTNLLKNAIEALDAAGAANGRIQVKAWREKDVVRISVKDNGPGIPPDLISRVFEPFFSTKRSGTGLGLTLVQQIVREHGGEISCTSAQGEGTVFRISLPD